MNSPDQSENWQFNGEFHPLNHSLIICDAEQKQLISWDVPAVRSSASPHASSIMMPGSAMMLPPPAILTSASFPPLSSLQLRIHPQLLQLIQQQSTALNTASSSSSSSAGAAASVQPAASTPPADRMSFEGGYYMPRAAVRSQECRGAWTTFTAATAGPNAIRVFRRDHSVLCTVGRAIILKDSAASRTPALAAAAATQHAGDAIIVVAIAERSHQSKSRDDRKPPLVILAAASSPKQRHGDSGPRRIYHLEPAAIASSVSSAPTVAAATAAIAAYTSWAAEHPIEGPDSRLHSSTSADSRGAAAAQSKLNYRLSACRVSIA